MDGKAELAKATEYWGKVYAKNPKDAAVALNYARNLKAQGEKQQALAVLQQASAANPTHKASPASTAAWRWSSTTSRWPRSCWSRPTIRSIRTGRSSPRAAPCSPSRTSTARPSRCSSGLSQLAPEQPSVMSNLALAYAMDGNVEKAEPLLRRAAALGGDDARVNQNLALVLGLQGKYDEAKVAIARDMPPTASPPTSTTCSRS